MQPPLSPTQAWEPLPKSQWNEETARHLLRRAGWSAHPEAVARAVSEGLAGTLDRLFPAKPPAFERPRLVRDERERATDFRERAKAAPTEMQRREIAREHREVSRLANIELSLAWLQQAATPANSAFEKWLLFLGDVYVVGVEKVRGASLIFDHYDTLRQGALGPAPALTKAVSRSVAMIIYLDLQRSVRQAPNENFARELMELFTLGQGNYTETDIKQAARAFTGYRMAREEFRFDRKQHDDGPKTIFGHTGRFNGDDVIDLIYGQPAAGTFLPREMTRFYLTDEVPDAAFFAPLGAWWKERKYNLRDLCHRYFSSAVFYHPAYRANYIKSPIHYQLGLLQDLQLDVAPMARTTLLPLRQMGQQPFNPPNVRGWVGGKLWINSSTLAARRLLVQFLFAPLDEDRINADDKAALKAARAAGYSRFTVDEDYLRKFEAPDVDATVNRLAARFLPTVPDKEYHAALRSFLKGPSGVGRIRGATIAILETPEYQLC
ncbi:MAG: DUF1800 domain-containing protein [Opitutaceae bacterium]|nr:DUF1800 domain-containing protein [Opitutaceae bacterium]